MIYDEMEDRPNPEDERAEAWEFWHERANKLEVENAKLRAAQKWQDISTAPKDGTQILIGGTNWRGKFFMADAIWRDGWMLFHPDEDDYTAESHNPTHWHPLPAPPDRMIADYHGGEK
jgi:hypothetical protein